MNIDMLLWLDVNRRLGGESRKDLIDVIYRLEQELIEYRKERLRFVKVSENLTKEKMNVH